LGRYKRAIIFGVNERTVVDWICLRAVVGQAIEDGPSPGVSPSALVVEID
jgi:hypothetical protein